MIAATPFPLQADPRYPFYALVPKDFRENLRFRERLIRWGEDDADVRADLWEMCRRDFLFWVNAFCWINEPRADESAHRALPFITRSMQDAAFDRLLGAVPRRDVTVFKSRDVGFSWMGMSKAAHDFLFAPMTEIGVVSARAELVDEIGAKSTLFAKIDFLLDEDRYPWFLLPATARIDGKRYRRNLRIFENVENGSSIKGFAATGDVFRSTRPTWAFMDEIGFFPDGQDQNAMAASQHATRCRVIGSTPNLPAGVFYNRVKHREKFDAAFVEMPWEEDPEKAAGLYTSDDGRLKVIDRDFWARLLGCRVADLDSRLADLQARYPFNLDGELRSPYFDYECKRADDPQKMAKELSRRFEGTGGPFFKPAVFERLRAECCRPPVLRGRFVVDPETLAARWHEDPNGPVLLWVSLDVHGKPPSGRRYVVASDVAAGTGGAHSSNSVTAIADAATGEQVGEFAVADMQPPAFARWNVGVSKLFNEAYHVWDANGPTGAQYTDEIGRIGYANVYRRAVDEIGRGPGGKKTKKIGFHTGNEEVKVATLSALGTAIQKGRYVPRSEAFFEELAQYVWKGGKVVHATAVTTDDGSAQGKAHGDRVIGHALAVKGIDDRPASEPDAASEVAKPGTLAWRMQEAERLERESKNEFDWND